MLNIVLYFQVHQPRRLGKYKVLHIGSNDNYFDDELNRKILNKVSDKCYLRTNRLLLSLIDRFKGEFKVSFSLTGSIIEQLRRYRPEVLESFRQLAATGQVEFMAETYYHSLSSLFDEEEFFDQVGMHSELMETEFGQKPVTFRNTELIYCDKVAELVSQIDQFKIILAEGAEKILGWRSPLYAYSTYNANQLLLLKYYQLADDIAFRFSNKSWLGFPLTVERFVEWIERLGLLERDGRELYVNLFMDYETFGEHQWEDTGIFAFLEHLPGCALKNGHIRFANPRDAIDSINYQPARLSVKEPVSWADTERDLSAWFSNSLQSNALRTYHDLLKKIKRSGSKHLIDVARGLSTSDIYYYMCTKYFNDGDVHKYFSPYDSPEQAYVYFINVLADLEKRIEKETLV